MTWPAVKFVSAPDPAATVRLDLSTPTVRVAADGFSLGAPSFSGSPTSVGVEYGYRDGLSFDVTVMGSKSSALAVLQTLARETMRQSNWLLFQLQPSSAPVWFKTYRGQPGALSLDNVYDESTGDTIADRWVISVPLVAEGLAYGAREALPAFTVSNDPAAGTNPCFAVLGAIKGDAPTPLRVQVNPSNSNYMNGYRWMLASSTFDGSHTPLVWQIGSGDGWTAGADTAAATTDGTYSGGSYRAVSFGTTPGLADRISGLSPTAVTPGLYKVLVRVARSDTSSTFYARFGMLLGFGYGYGDTVLMDRFTSTGTGHATWVDVGNFAMPPGSEGLPDEAVGISGQANIALQLGRASGSGSARLDAIKLIPLSVSGQVDSRLLYTYFPDSGIFISGGIGVWDGDMERFWAWSQFGGLVAIRAEMAGSFLLAYPGRTNLLHVLQQVNGQRSSIGDDAPDLISTSTAVTVSYFPRYLNLRAD